MYKKLLDLYPWINPQTIQHFAWLRNRFHFDSVDDFRIMKDENNIPHLLTYIDKIIQEFSRGEYLNISLIFCLWNRNKIDWKFLSDNFPSEIKELFHMKDWEIIKYDDLYYIIFDVKKLKVIDIKNIIKYLVLADTDFLNKENKHIWNVYFYPEDMSRLLNLYDDRWMDICYQKPENYFYNQVQK